MSTASKAEAGIRFSSSMSRGRPTPVGGALEVPGGPVVRQHEAVLRHRTQHDPRLGGVRRDVVAGVEPEARPHRRVARIIGRAGLVACRPQVGPLRDRRGEADRMVDVARPHLVVAQEAREDRQAGGVGRRPAIGPQPVRAQVPHRARPCRPPPALQPRVPRLVQPTGARIDHDRVAIAVGVPAALDARGPAQRVAHPVALVGVLERHAHARPAVHDRHRDAVGHGLLAVRRTEVRVQRGRRLHEDSHVVRAGLDRKAVDARMPVVVAREHRALGAGQVPVDRCARGGCVAVRASSAAVTATEPCAGVDSGHALSIGPRRRAVALRPRSWRRGSGTRLRLVPRPERIGPLASPFASDFVGPTGLEPATSSL